MAEPDGGRMNQARALAEQALRAQAAGLGDEADRLFAEAERIDPQEVANVLEEHEAAGTRDAGDPPPGRRP